MIDTFTENVISLRKAAEHIANITGRQRERCESLVTRWSNAGQYGVVLETIIIGRQRFTSTEAIDRFLNDSEAARKQTASEAIKAGLTRKLSPAAQRELDARLKRKGVIKNASG